LQALPPGVTPTTSFHDAACATLRLSRARGRFECDALAVGFEADPCESHRLFVLDLMARAGTPEAQATIRALLDLPSVRQANSFATFLQRLGFVERPDAATLAYLLSGYESVKYGQSTENNEVRMAALYALGSAVGRAHVWGLAADATRAMEVLRADLRAARTSSERLALLTAMGNAGLESEVALILSHVGDPDEAVKVAAVLALRKLHSPRAKSWLIGAVGGSDEVIAESALSALFEQSLMHHELLRLAELVLGGYTLHALDARILRLLLTQRIVTKESMPIIEEAVQLLLHRSGLPAASRPLDRRTTPSRREAMRPMLDTGSGEFARLSRPPPPPSIAPATRRSATDSLRGTMPAPAAAESHVRPKSTPPPPETKGSEPIVNAAFPIKPLAVL
jgi:hypothetical protein